MKITITKQDIEDTIKYFDRTLITSTCPVARMCQRALGDSTVTVGCSTISGRTAGLMEIKPPLPIELYEFHNFQERAMDNAPYEFELVKLD